VKNNNHKTVNTKQRSSGMKEKVFKKYLKIMIGVIAFLISATIFSDWEHFKAGFMAAFD
jgi:hypothetical protein